MLRIPFTADDIARTRIAAGPDPLWEVVLGLHMLRRQRGDLLFGEWRRRTVPALARTMHQDQLRLLLALSPPLGYFPDFLTPITAVSQGLEAGLDAVRSTPARRLRHDMGRLAAGRRLPRSMAALARGEPAALDRLTDGLRRFHDVAIAPYRRRLEGALDRDRGIRVDAMRDGGVEGLFTSLRTWVDWTGSELRVPSHRDHEVHLVGRGLLLIPSYFNVVTPLTLFDDNLPPVLIYPVERPPGMGLTGVPPDSSKLERLIGPTRAAVLRAIGSGATTGELARRTGVSAPSASEHASVLRAARLITSRRDGNRMVHQLSAVGRQLLEEA
jgi:DNA-binding transcriptional ArsR family regulator